MLCWIESCGDACVSVKSFNIVLNYPIEKKYEYIFFVSMSDLYCKVALCHEPPQHFVCSIQAPTRLKETYIYSVLTILIKSLIY